MSSGRSRALAVILAIAFATPGVLFAVVAIEAMREGESARQTAVMSLAAIICFLIALALTVAAVAGARKARRRDELRRRFPDHPWMWNDQWVTRSIPDQSQVRAASFWLIAILLIAGSVPALFVLPREIEKGNHTALVIAVLPFVGAGFLVAAIRGTLRALRFRRSTFHLSTLPAVAGGALRGNVEVLGGLSVLGRAEEVLVTLTAVRRRITGSGRSQSVTETTLWRNEDRVPRQRLVPAAEAITIPIDFAIPADAPPVDDRDPNDRVLWRLAVSADVPGVDYASTFEVPVFHRQS